MEANVTPLRRLAADVPAEHYEAMENRAKANDRSVAAELRVMVRAYLAESDKEKAA